MDLQQLEGQLTRWRRSRRHRRRLPEEVWASAVELARTHGLSREEARRLAEAKGLTLVVGNNLIRPENAPVLRALAGRWSAWSFG